MSFLIQKIYIYFIKNRDLFFYRKNNAPENVNIYREIGVYSRFKTMRPKFKIGHVINYLNTRFIVHFVSVFASRWWCFSEELKKKQTNKPCFIIKAFLASICWRYSSFKSSLHYLKELKVLVINLRKCNLSNWQWFNDWTVQHRM